MDNLEFIIKLIIILVVIIAGITDLKTGKVYNWLTLPAIILGLILNSLLGFHSLLDSLIGFIIGFGVFFIFYLLGGMGGGDVKLMAAIGALGGVNFTIAAIAYGAISGGIAALIYMLIHGTVIITLKKLVNLCISLIVPGLKVGNELKTTTTPKFPYATFAISIGTILAIILPLEFF